MDCAKVYGAAFSVYVQAVRLTLATKGVQHRLIEVDPFQPDGPGDEHLARNPFGHIPAFENEKVRLYEAEAIARYIDDSYPGQPLMPAQLEQRARANQILSILKSYAYPSWVWAFYVETVSKPRRGEEPDQSTLIKMLPIARIALSEIARLKRECGGGFLAGKSLTLPDLFCVPMFATFTQAPASTDLLKEHPALQEWWQYMRQQEIVQRLVV